MTQMVNCKSCGAEIAKSAKTCPHCGAKQPNLIAAIVWVVIGIVILYPSIGRGPKKIGDINHRLFPTTTQSIKQTVFRKGEQVELNNIVATLVDVSESDGDGIFLTPDDGNVFVLCEFEIKNNSSKEISVSSLLSFDVYVDDYSTDWSITAEAGAGKPALDGKIAAGKKLKGVVAREVSKGWSDIEIRFKPDFWSSKDITFAYRKYR